MVAAAGNAGADVRGYFPANCEGVLSVGASTEGGRLAAYSNFGADILAPGICSSPLWLLYSVSLAHLYGTSIDSYR